MFYRIELVVKEPLTWSSSHLTIEPRYFVFSREISASGSHENLSFLHEVYRNSRIKCIFCCEQRKKIYHFWTDLYKNIPSAWVGSTETMKLQLFSTREKTENSDRGESALVLNWMWWGCPLFVKARLRQSFKCEQERKETQLGFLAADEKV